MGKTLVVRRPLFLVLVIFFFTVISPQVVLVTAWQSSSQQPPPPPPLASRRDVLACGGGAPLVAVTAASASASRLLPTAPALAAQPPNGLKLNDSPSGLKWADAKVGSGQALRTGQTASIDYSMASTAGRFPLIYSTKDSGSPYRWTLGDGSTIKGIEMAILGDDMQGIPPMVPGSIRRVIVPESLGYLQLKVNNNGKCSPQDIGNSGGASLIGPIPPKENIVGSGAYQRWYQFYCNPRIPYQPDLVLDIKLYGKR
jgi:FKBP-type peptidyl-prolyl cis-trans isomerase